MEEKKKLSDVEKEERRNIWKVAIGLQRVDGLGTSDHLISLANRHINGDITIKEVQMLIEDYYRDRHVNENQEIKK